MTDGFDVVAFVVDAAVSDDGADDRVACHFHVLRAFDQCFESGLQIAAAAVPQAGRVRMTIDGPAAIEFIFLDDILDAAPSEEIVFDGSAMRVAANRAMALVVT